MTVAHRSSEPKISAVVSDVDGTLVTDGKVLTARTRSAVAKIHARGIVFTIISSRPPRGLRMLFEPLAIVAPFAAFNGGMIAAPNGPALVQHALSPITARNAIDMLEQCGIPCWVFTKDEWLARDAAGPYVDREAHTVQFGPTIVESFDSYLSAANKIVGVSPDFGLLAVCEREMTAAFEGRASVARSQPYYLDITHRLANKGVALGELAKLLDLPPAEIAVIGDGRNDVAMFRTAGLSIAMGNASLDVQRAAHLVTATNGDDGFASAIEQLILGRQGSDTAFDAAPARGDAC